MLGGGICECLLLGDIDVTFPMVKRAYQNFNISNVSRELKRVERECLLINFTTREIITSALGIWSLYNNK